MRRDFFLQAGIIAFLAASFSDPCLAHSTELLQADQSQINLAIKMFENGNLNDANAIAQKAAGENPSSWQAHATLSFLAWKQGNIMLAMNEGEEACKIAPENELILNNLACMNEILGDYKNAIHLYEKAQKISNGCGAGLGLARSRIKGGEREAGLAILNEMAAQSGKNFQWYQQISDCYMQIGEAALAANVAEKAVDSAITAEQKSTALPTLFLAQLKCGQIDTARPLMKKVFESLNQSNYELYVLAAERLLDPALPSSAELIRAAAQRNLKLQEDADGFYRLGRVFQSKASLIVSDPIIYKQWMEFAKDAYTRATQLDPGQGRYHLALAGALGRYGNYDQFIDELNKAKSLDSFDALSPFLLAHCQKLESASQTDPHRIKLSKVKFKIKGLSCACHVSKVETTLCSIEGVAFAHISREENPAGQEGVLLMDESAASTSDVFAKCNKDFLSPSTNTAQLQIDTAQKETSSKTKELFRFELISQEALVNTDEAVRIAQTAKYEDPTSFVNQMIAVEPVLPVQVKRAPEARISTR